jgi:hypothetical protein
MRGHARYAVRQRIVAIGYAANHARTTARIAGPRRAFAARLQVGPASASAQVRRAPAFMAADPHPVMRTSTSSRTIAHPASGRAALHRARCIRSRVQVSILPAYHALPHRRHGNRAAFAPATFVESDF